MHVHAFDGGIGIDPQKKFKERELWTEVGWKCTLYPWNTGAIPIGFFLVWVVSAMLELVFVSVCVLSLGGCEQ